MRPRRSRAARQRISGRVVLVVTLLMVVLVIIARATTPHPEKAVQQRCAQHHKANYNVCAGLKKERK